jgi:FAD/FMN-containing dehydrogenase
VDQSLNELRRSLAGGVLAPADPGYDAARRSFNALIDRRPAVIARTLGVDDVATGFDFAPAEGLEVTMRGGGHNPAGTACVTAGWSSICR